MNLSQISVSYKEQYGSEKDAAIAFWDRFFERFGKFAFGGLVGIIFVGVIILIYTVVTSMIFSGKNPVIGSFVAVFIIFAVMTLIWVFYNEAKKDRPNAKADEADKHLLEGTDTQDFLQTRSSNLFPL
ncbi:MAG: hypothetical protein KF685_04250 [Acidobacteria bacterium]|nr:hypothetical protein [Acidobacteriota bacterium]